MQRLGTRNGAVGRGGHGGCGLALLGIALLAWTGAAQAELRKVESVGIHGIREASRGREIPRDQAIGAAIWEGVSRVALELMGESVPDESGPSPSEDTVASLRETLGDDLLPYTRGFRILEDKGEVPALFAEQDDVRTEYVVVVEVVVDADRVGAALERAGLVEGALGPGSGGGASIRLELVGLSHFPAYAEVVKALEGAMGATRVVPIEFSPERQVLEVEGPFGVERLAQRLEALDRSGLSLTTVSEDVAGRRLQMRGLWAPVLAVPDPAAEGSPGASSGLE
ncbi:MAG: hypothetical protein R3F16_09100 [Myxococcota bacterium]